MISTLCFLTVNAILTGILTDILFKGGKVDASFVTALIFTALGNITIPGAGGLMLINTLISIGNVVYALVVNRLHKEE